MQCPNDGQTLVMATREGIEIDYCPSCRGVWLDRGELDKIIERSSAAASPAGEPHAAPERRYDADDDHDDRRRSYRPEGHGGDRGRGDYGDHGRRKRRSFLDDLFDFG